MESMGFTPLRPSQRPERIDPHRPRDQRGRRAFDQAWKEHAATADAEDDESGNLPSHRPLQPTPPPIRREAEEDGVHIDVVV